MLTGGRLVLASLVAALLLARCAGRGGNSASDVVVTLHVSPTTPAVGRNRVTVVITDKTGHPVDGAPVQRHGDVTHAGMASVVVPAATAGHGRYVADHFLIGMSGDWVFSVSGTFGDGHTLAHQFPAMPVGSPSR